VVRFGKLRRARFDQRAPAGSAGGAFGKTFRRPFTVCSISDGYDWRCETARGSAFAARRLRIRGGNGRALQARAARGGTVSVGDRRRFRQPRADRFSPPERVRVDLVLTLIAMSCSQLEDTWGRRRHSLAALYGTEVDQNGFREYARPGEDELHHLAHARWRGADQPLRRTRFVTRESAPTAKPTEGSGGAELTLLRPTPDRITEASALEPLWNLFDLTPEGRPTDWDEQLSCE